MADKITEAVKTALEILANAMTAGTTTIASTSESPTKKRRYSANAKKATPSKKETKAEAINEQVYENEEEKRLRIKIDQKRESQRNKNNKADETSTRATNSSICTRRRKTIDPKIKANETKPIVMTEEMRRIKRRIEEKKQLKNRKTNETAASFNTTSTPSTSASCTSSASTSARCTNDSKTTNVEAHTNRKRKLDIDNNIGACQECVFCGIMVEATSYNCHITIMHPEMFQKKKKY